MASVKKRKISILLYGQIKYFGVFDDSEVILR